MEKVSIIVPAYNEGKIIRSSLDVYYKFFKTLKQDKKLDFELLVVVNGSKDNTYEVAKDFGKNKAEIRVMNLISGGKGFAVIEGFKDALKRDNHLIGFVDADLATLPDAYYSLIKASQNKRYGGVIASRGLKNSVVNTTFKRKLTNRGFNFFVRSILFFPYKDTQCGAKLFRREAIEAIINELGITKWAFDIELLYRIGKKGFKIIEIPTVWHDKPGSHLDMVRVPLQMAVAALRLRLIFSPLKFVVKAYDKIPSKLKFHNW